MKYDLKRLKEAIDREIPAPRTVYNREEADERRRRAGRTVLPRALTAAAAMIVVLCLLAYLLPDTSRPGTDHTGVLSPGEGNAPAQTAESAGTDAPAGTAQPGDGEPDESAGTEEDDGAPVEIIFYEDFSPDWGISAFPKEKECGDVTVRMTEDEQFVFEYTETGETALPGKWAQAFAWFPATGTGLVGNGEGLAILGPDGLTTGYIFDSLMYTGNGAAIVTTAEERAEYGAEAMIPQRIVSTADGRMLNENGYDEIGVTGSADVRFLLGVCYERAESGEIDHSKKLYTDVMDGAGRVIVRGYEYGGFSGGWLTVQMEEAGPQKMFDLQGNELMDGLEFTYVSGERWGMREAWLYAGGTGVLDENNEWVIEPDRYLTLDIVGEDRFEVFDYEGNRYLVNAAGEKVFSFRFRLRQLSEEAAACIADAAHEMGQAGLALAVLTAVWALIRLGLGRRRGTLRQMLLTEAGWAALIVGLIVLSHRFGSDQLWPTVTSTDGAYAMALGWALASAGGLIAMMSSWKWASRKWGAALLGALLLAGPWLAKAVCSDMSVREWRTASVLILGALPVLLLWIRKSRGFVRLSLRCAQAAEAEEYSRTGRRVWQILAAAAAVHFLLVSFLSGQEMISLHHRTSMEKGAAAFDAQWIEETNELFERYRAAEGDEEILKEAVREENRRGGSGWEKTAAVRWMMENGIDRLTEDMFYTVRLEGELALGRRARAQVWLSFADAETDALQIAAASPMDEDGRLTCECTVLLIPGRHLPVMQGNVYITQPTIEGIASQRSWQIDMGEVTAGDIEGESGVSGEA